MQKMDIQHEKKDMFENQGIVDFTVTLLSS